MEFTGEFFVPNKTGKRIEEDHYARYTFAGNYVLGKRVLDIACGVGYGSKVLGDLYKTYTGVDINFDCIKFAQINYANTKSEFICGDICSFNDKPFDIIICFETIEHISNYQDALQVLYTNLKQNGILIISSPNRIITSPKAKSIWDKPSNPFHFCEFTPKELIHELTNLGFTKEKIHLFGQRQGLHFTNSFLNKTYSFLFKPAFKSSSQVSCIIKNKIPRYFILVAEK